ncbi:hypothetical protein CPB84DRAFT_1764351 [Gymnopilus junonius]|uniref:F-box domain-containing protein n=1 Tax=Gymnopilus junonius TaxID=109634 RepID=A0A9P5NYQ2_GYMJU|nr:hypothetical protein CPB84DRAFT_1764351 [Gymnopilus junonius]
MSITHGQMAYSPIFHMGRDVLYAVFEWNADILTVFSDPSALHTTKQASQVCAEWHDILLSSPAIWGRLLDLSVLQWTSTWWRSEILHRSGNGSSLWILGTSINEKCNYDTKIKQIHRIEKLVINIEVERVHPLHWQEFYMPAPFLKVFDVIFTSMALTSVPFFNNIAPVLHTFWTQDIKLGLQAAWLSGLHSLKLKDCISVSLLLNALQMMPELSSLVFGNLIPDNSISLAHFPSISLPKLNRITFFHDITECMTLLEHVILKPGSYYQTHKPTIISLDMSCRAFHFELKSPGQGKAGFSIEVSNVTYFSGNLSMKVLLNLLSTCCIPSVRNLPEIELKCFRYLAMDYTLNAALFTFPFITTLLGDELMLGSLLALQSTSKNILFPYLKYLKLGMLNSTSFGRKDYLTQFLWAHKDMGLLIQFLDLTQCNPDILWKKCDSEKICQYKCGSRNPESIPFFMVKNKR